MKRLLLTLAAASLLAALAPASALAHHHGRGHLRGHAHRFHVRRFGSLDQTSPSPTTGSSSGIGTVASFQNGLLTILLNDGSTVAGNVTADTAISCPTSGSSQSGDDSGDSSDDQQSGDQSSSGGDTSAGGDQQSSGGDQQSSGDDDQSSGEDQQSSGGDEQSSGDDDQSSGGDDDSSSTGSGGNCSSADLTPGKTVLGAELRIDSTGKTWDKVDLGS